MSLTSILLLKSYLQLASILTIEVEGWGTFNNISVISWQSVLLVEETRVPGKTPQTCRKSLTKLKLYQVCLTMRGIQTHNLSRWKALVSLEIQTERQSC
jgi:hypothetical protein